MTKGGRLQILRFGRTIAARRHDPQIHLPHDTRRFGLDGDNYLGPCFLYRRLDHRLLGDYDPSLGIKDFDYWLRLSLVAPIAHLDSDEPLYQYRVHNNSINRADELKLPERTHQLVRTTIGAARNSTPGRGRSMPTRPPLAWLNKSDAVGHRVVPWSGEPLVGDGDEKVMLLVEAESLPAAVQSRGSAEKGDSPHLPERPGGCFAQMGTVPFSRQRFAWLPGFPPMPTRRTAIGPSGEGRPTCALRRTRPRRPAWRCCRAAHLAGRAGPQARDAGNDLGQRQAVPRSHPHQRRADTSLPRVFRPEKRAVRVLLQADNFTQGGTEQVVLDLARHLRTNDFDVSLLILGKQGCGQWRRYGRPECPCSPCPGATARATIAAC